MSAIDISGKKLFDSVSDNASLQISGKDLLDMFSTFTSDVYPSDQGADIPPSALPEFSGYGLGSGRNPQGFEQSIRASVVGAKSSLPNSAEFQEQAQMAFGMAGITNYAPAEKKYELLGRCAPVGGAFPAYFAPGFDDGGYTEPQPSSNSLRASELLDPIKYQNIALPHKMNSMRVNGIDAGQKAKKKTDGVRKPHPVVEKARRDNINKLIESLREIIPPGGWGNPKQDLVNDKRTKRTVLMDTIVSIDRLEFAVEQARKTLKQAGLKENELDDPGLVGMKEEASLVVRPGEALNEDEMQKVDVDIMKSEENQYFVKVEYFDRRGFLADECVAMRSLGINIKSAALPKAERGGQVKDIFEIEPLEKDKSNLDALRDSLQEALNETQALYYHGEKVGEKRVRS